MPKSKKTKNETKKIKSKKNTKESAKQETHGGHAIWKGYISFGLVNIPIIIVSAEKPQEEVHFKLLDKRKLSPIKYVRVNVDNGKEVPWEDVVKGFEYEAGTYVILEEEDLQEISLENQKLIEIEDFVDKEAVSSLFYEKPYYLLPDKRAQKGYALLRDTLKSTKKIGIAKIMIRSHQYLAAIIPYGNAIIVNTLRYPAEIKNPEEINLPEEVVRQPIISKKELDIAKQLVETMSVKWDPKRYKNEYREALMQLIEGKIASGGKKVTKHIKESPVKQTNVIDFMDLLKKSIKEKKSNKRKFS